MIFSSKCTNHKPFGGRTLTESAGELIVLHRPSSWIQGGPRREGREGKKEGMRSGWGKEVTPTLLQTTPHTSVYAATTCSIRHSITCYTYREHNFNFLFNLSFRIYDCGHGILTTKPMIIDFCWCCN